jgi:hypothetical protein
LTDKTNNSWLIALNKPQQVLLVFKHGANVEKYIAIQKKILKNILS